MKFLMMVKHAESALITSPTQPLYDAMGALVSEGFAQGWLKDTGGLKKTAEARRITSRGGKLTTTDGPFAESKELVGGYALIETKTRDEAMVLAERFMELHTRHVPEFECECEVRQVEEM